MANAGTIAPSASASHNVFASELFNAINSNRVQENVIFSPASIQSCGTLAFLGARGRTADEMRQALRLGAGDNLQIAKNYAVFLQSAFKNTAAAGPQLTMANRIYVNEGLKIVPKFNELATKYFDTEAEHIQFAESAAAAEKINNWVEKQTHDKIQNLLQPSSVNADTSLVLVNAIYFKAKWAKPFSKSSTHKSDFAVNAREKVSVDTMFLNEQLNYVDLPDMDATAVEMPYENSDLSMLILLPKKVDGLKELETKLKNLDLNEISAKMTLEKVDLFLPKFRIEFDIDLEEPFKKLGMCSPFSDKADFSGLLTTETPQKISEVKHKAFIDVNEAGSEAAAATFIKIVPMSLDLSIKSFRADHPFVFAIRNKEAVYFAGHVANFENKLG